MLLNLTQRDRRWLIIVLVITIVVQGGMLIEQFSTLDGDFAGHVRIARRIVEEGVLEGPHIVYHTIVNAITPIVGNAMVAGYIVVLIAALAVVPIIYRMIRPVLPIDEKGARRTALFTLGLLFVTPIALPTLAETNFYFGYVTANAIHNPTTIAVKPFALLVFLVTLAALQKTQRLTLFSWFVTTLLVVLCLFTKPNYLICLVPALVVVVGYRLWRKAPVNAGLIISAIIVPTVLLLGLQYALAFGQPEAGIEFAPFNVMRLMTGFEIPQLLLQFILSILFPLLVMVFHWREARRDLGLVLSWLTFGVGAALMYLFNETGERMLHGNFWWSAQITLFVLFVYSTMFYLRQTVQNARQRDRLLTLVFGLHVLFGILYYIAVFLGSKYY